MADLNDLADPTRTASFVDSEGGDSVVVDTQALPRPTANGERSKILREEFSISFAELQGMSKAEIWDMYVQEVVRRIIKRAKAIQTRLGRNLEFRSFTLPGNTARRRVFSYERNGIFIGIMFRRIDLQVNPDVPEQIQDEVEVTVQGEIGLAGVEEVDIEPDDPTWTPNQVPARHQPMTNWERFKGADQ